MMNASLLPAAILAAASAFAADPACKTLGDANAKIYTIPTHIYMTETAVYTGGKARTSELIYLNNKTYILANGKWISSPVTPKDLEADRAKADDPGAGLTCRVVRDESVNGEAASLYSTHQQTPDFKTDSQVWISKSRGVPLKIEADTDVGGAAGKSHRVMRYEYSNVQAPAGVR
jgi:hypothetical protein